MSQWGVWEWVAFTTLWIGAIILAIDGGLRLAPDVRARLPKALSFLKSPWWAFAPLLFVLLGTLLLIGNEFALLPSHPGAPKIAVVVAIAAALASVFVSSRRTADTKGKLDTDWDYPINAIEKFVPASLLRKRDEARELSRTLSHEEERLKRHSKAIHAIQPRSALSGVDPAEPLLRDLNDVQRRIAEAEAIVAMAEAAIEGNFKGQLARGHLVAKAFKLPHSPGANSVTIKAEEWGVLEFDPSDMTKRVLVISGGGKAYNGLWVAKRGP